MKPEIICRLRLLYEKRGISELISQRNFARILERSLRRIDFPFKFTEGFHPRPRLSFGPPLPVNIAGLNEAVDIYTSTLLNEEKLLSRINPLLPEGTRVLRAEWVPLSLPSLVKSALLAMYFLKGECLPSRDQIPSFVEIRDEKPHQLILLIKMEGLNHTFLRDHLGFITVERFILWSADEEGRSNHN
ncbi:MAG: TIGR03936 family radical SAM-associated protein [Candidatus Omnitrophica bacterium]|nr:TIGR03936 family radical SAM-associated protein [Candidatus Omnitrophota bacterium]